MAKGRKLIKKTKGRIMKTQDVLRVAFGNLRRNKLRTALTTLGVVIGISAIVFLVSLGFGLQRLAIRQTTTLKALTVLSVSPSETAAAKLTPEVVAKFKKIKEVEAVSPAYQLAASLSLGSSGGTTEATLYGVEPRFLSLADIKPTLGKTFKGVQEKRALLSPAALKALNISKNQALKKEIIVNVYFSEEKTNEGKPPKSLKLERIKIGGVLKKGSEAYLYLPLGLLKGLGKKEYSEVKVKVTSQEKLSKVRSQIEKMGFRTSSVTGRVQEIVKIFVAVRIFFFIFGAIALFVASIMLLNIMTIALLERTHEIGIMKAVGITNKDIRRIFVYEAGLIGFFGGILGGLLGFLAGKGANFLANIVAAGYKGSSPELFYTPPQFLLFAFILALIVGTSTGVYPARRAAKLNPAEALRFE